MASARFLFLVLLGACAAPVEPAPATSPPQVVLHGVTVANYRGSQLTSSGRAAQVSYERVGGDVHASEAQLRLPPDAPASEPGKGEVNIRALTVNANVATRQAQGSGGVTLRTPAGLLAETSAAHFDGVLHQANGESSVQVHGPGYALRARRFEFDLVTGELLFDGAVDSTLGGPTR